MVLHSYYGWFGLKDWNVKKNSNALYPIHIKSFQTYFDPHTTWIVGWC